MSNSISFRLQSQFNRIEEGWTVKEGHFRKNWNRRYLHIDMEKKILSYYADDTKRVNQYKFIKSKYLHH